MGTRDVPRERALACIFCHLKFGRDIRSRISHTMAAELNVNELYPLTDETDTLTDKDWAGGSRECEEVKELTVPRPGEPAIVPMAYPPRFTKMADELVVNALDHIIRCIGTATQVTKIAITFNASNDSISVYNDGAGIPCVVHDAASAKFRKTMYVAEFILGVLFQGSNRDRSADCIIGGTNGVGVKLVNANSTRFTVETVDLQRQLRYEQTWTNNMRATTPPTITKVADLKGPARRWVGTRITYWPDWQHLNLAKPSTSADTTRMIDQLLRTRAATAAVYAAFATRGPTKTTPAISYELVTAADKPVNEVMRFKTTTDLAACIHPGLPAVTMRVFPTDEFVTTAKGKTNKKPQCDIYNMDWEATVVITEQPCKKDCDSLTVINGVVARDGGHIRRVREIITDAIVADLRGEINEADMKRAKTMIESRTFIVLYCQIPNPGWEGQRKDRLSQTKAKFSHYNVEPKATKQVSKLLVDSIKAAFVSGATKSAPAEKPPAIPVEIYVPALGIGKKSIKNRRLNVCEGSSAMSGIKSMKLSPEVYGILAIGGVIVNARRETDVTDGGVMQYVHQSEKFTKNKMIGYIMYILGIRVNVKYTLADIPKLPYDGGVIMCVDQDLDGKGFILGLFISMFAKLWPGLLEAGYIKWFSTPIIRAWPPSSRKKGAIIEQFYTVAEYEQWAAATPGSDKYDVRYYKGLAGHEPEDWKDMAKTFEEHTFVYKYDPVKHNEWFDIYFGDIAAKRREVLRSEPYAITDEEILTIARTKMIPCDLHMRTETHEYQLDNLQRKLPHAIDGQTQGSRKIVHGAIMELKINGTPKVAQFAAAVALTQNYHHGEASLENSIYCRMQIYAGGTQLPIIRPSGLAGTRQWGGDDHGSARYVKVKSNAKLLNLIFPADDYQLLPFTLSEGKQYEPDYFVPIIPLAICESMHLPAHGWKVQLWARDLLSIVRRVRICIASDDVRNIIARPHSGLELPPYEYRNTCNPYTGGIYGDIMYGKYTIAHGSDRDTVTITELPLRVWTINYLKALVVRAEKAPHEIYSAVDASGDTNRVCLRVETAPGLFKSIAERSDCSEHEAIMHYLRLQTTMTHHINMIGVNGAVVEFDRYIDVLHNWYPHRRDMYVRRCERKSVVLGLQIRMQENIVRYVTESAQLKLGKLPVAIMCERLSSAGYDRFCRAIVNDPKFMPTGDIIAAATLSDKANYDYLINLRDRDKSAEAVAEWQAELDKLRAAAAEHEKLCRMGAFPGAELWRRELDALVAVYNEGVSSDWTYGENAGLTYA